jgi:hypothetical protein
MSLATNRWKPSKDEKGTCSYDGSDVDPVAAGELGMADSRMRVVVEIGRVD